MPVKVYDGTNWVTVAGDGAAGAPGTNGLNGKIAQVVRASDTTLRTTTSTSYVDVTGLSVTITPTTVTSTILLISTFSVYISRTVSNPGYSYFRIADSSNNAISGAESIRFGQQLTGGINYRQPITMFAYASPGTTSAVTYKTRFLSESSDISTNVANGENTGQMYAIEVLA
jgi:hypothetical protein